MYALCVSGIGHDTSTVEILAAPYVCEALPCSASDDAGEEATIVAADSDLVVPADPDIAGH